LNAVIAVIHYKDIVIRVDRQPAKAHGIEFTIAAALFVPFGEEVSVTVKDQNAVVASVEDKDIP